MKPFTKYGWSKLGGECSVAMYKNSLILRITMCEKPFIHKKAFYDIETNFLLQTETYDYVITNPPFSLAYEFVQKAKQLATKKFAFLLPLSYLHGKSRYDGIYMDKQYGLKKVYVFTRYPMLGNPLREDGKYNTGI
jgi:23S rRNA A1618 N6-methylase RlmF